MAHKSEAAILAEIERAKQQISKGDTYAHYKDKTKIYKVRDFVLIEATDELGVVYEAQYGAQLRFVRSVKVWLEEVEWQGEKMPRFTKLS